MVFIRIFSIFIYNLDIVVIIIIYFRMSGLPKILLSGDSPSALTNHEEDESTLAYDHEVTQQLGEAMEDSVTIEIQASYEGGEGCAENTVNPPKGARRGGREVLSGRIL